MDGKHIWTIEAPYAFDAVCNNVTSYISLDGDKYTIGITPTADTVFPVTLDPTVTLTFSNLLLWNTQDVVQTSTIPTTRVVIGRSGSNPIKNITVYNERATIKISGYVKTNYTNNISPMVKTYYQFFNSTGTALNVKQDLIVASGTYIVTITVPSGAYYIEFSGIADGISTVSVFNVLKITAIECTDYYSHWDFARKAMTNYGKNIGCAFPETWFNNSMADVAGYTTIEAPPGDTTFYFYFFHIF